MAAANMSRKTEAKPMYEEELNVLTEKMHQLWENHRSVELKSDTANTDTNKVKDIANNVRQSMDYQMHICNMFEIMFPGHQEVRNSCRVTLDMISRKSATLHQAGTRSSRQGPENKSDDNGNVFK
ncbi:uncharacterized protein LOC109607912 [Aethina tumida]|uniref:uncharacterized protein LOC109607912 n=1 Tax=Aethina tumida TaxID=116153 RepID=UPI00096B15CF|nr:uncharacterized protein LOC109607912 [Aethina tumida]